MFCLLMLACGGAESQALPPGAGEQTERSSDASAGATTASPSGGGLLGGLFSSTDCDDDSLASQPLKHDCVTENISCGQTIKGHTGGGSRFWNGDFYRSEFCAPVSSGTYEGSERIYFLDSPAEVEVRVELVSDCTDLDLFLLSWPDPKTCPTLGYSIGTCEADTSSGGGRVKVQNINKAYSYLIAVESSNGKTAPFEIKVECQKLLER